MRAIMSMDLQGGDNPATTSASPRTAKIQSRASLYLSHSLDIGYLSSRKDNGSQLFALEEGIVQSFTARIVGAARGRPAEIGGWTNGRSEVSDLKRRGEDAREANGKNLWVSNLVEEEAALIFDSLAGNLDSTIRSKDGKYVRLLPATYFQARIFPRGVLNLLWTCELGPADYPSNFECHEFIAFLRTLKALVRKEATRHIEDFCMTLEKGPANAWNLKPKWSESINDLKQLIATELVCHSTFLLESLPGEAVQAVPTNYDELSESQTQALYGVLNQTDWLDQVTRSESIQSRFIRNRKDELFITDGDTSLVVLAGFWSDGDTLKTFYLKDLLVSIQFELARLAHLRYLAFLMHSNAATDALALRGNNAKALKFVTTLLQAVRGSDYNRPAAPLINHGFTRRVLTQIAEQRGTALAVSELESFSSRVRELVALRAGMRTAANTLWATVAGSVFALGAVIFTAAPLVVSGVPTDSAQKVVKSEDDKLRDSRKVSGSVAAPLPSANKQP